MRQGLASLSAISMLLFGDISSAMNVNETGDSDQASGQRVVRTAPVISESDYKDWFASAENGDIDKMKSLMRKGIDVNRRNIREGSGWMNTALEIAARNGHVDVVNLLQFTTEKIVGLLNMCKNKQRVGDSDLKRHLFDAFDYGETLTGAAYNGRTKVVELLLDRGVDVNYRDGFGNTALVRAASGGHAEIVDLLLDHGADVNSQNEWGDTALILAAERGHTEVVRILLNHGADVNSQDNSEPALIMAARDEYTEIIELLLNHGADVNSQDNCGMTALMYTAYVGRTETVELLLDRGANPNILDFDGGTALDRARKGDNSEVISLLEEALLEEALRKMGR